MSVRAQTSAAGLELTVELERGDLLPGRLVAGVLRLVATADREIRGISAALVGTEHWQFERTEHSGTKAGYQTRTVTAREQLSLVPLALHGPARLARGEERVVPFEVPVPALGPATLEATVAGILWAFEVRIDIPGRPDVGLSVPVAVHQPTALLRAGVVRVGQFALFEGADAASGAARATLELDPVPLCLGAPAVARLTVAAPEANLQEIRLELRVHVEATVTSGKEEELTIGTWRVAGEGRFGGEAQALEMPLAVPALRLPTIVLPHGRTAARLHLILARAFARDIHLVRDVALCTTTEI